MTRKVLWIAVWTTLVLWLGNFWGCTTAPMAARQDPEPAASPVMPDAIEADSPQVAAADAATPDAVSPGVDSMDVASTSMKTNPSGSRGTLDRSDWPRTVIRSGDGTVRHYPLYWKDYPLWQPRRALENDPLTQIDHALDGAHAENWSLNNLGGLFVQPVKFGLDSTLLGPNMAIDLPWNYAYSP